LFFLKIVLILAKDATVMIPGGDQQDKLIIKNGSLKFDIHKESGKNSSW
jgi:hypothetical protein